MTILQAIQRGADALRGMSSDARRDAALLLRHIISRDRVWLLAHPETELTEQQRVAYEGLVTRRAAHEPIQYILGEQEFYGLRFAVSPAVLIPRPETEHLVEAVLERLPQGQPARVVDVGTGSGAIAVALAHTRPELQITALDTSPAALQIARLNATSNGVADRIRFAESDLLAAVEGEQFDSIVSNPPYVPDGDLLEPQVRDWEPHLALFAGVDGLDIYRRLVVQATKALAPGGLLAMEAGAGQQAALNTLLGDERTWSRSEWVPDLQGIPRVVVALRRAPGN
jgi:release factor glutamine methyltransferase